MEDEDNNSSCTRVDSEDFTDDVVLVEARCQEKVAELPRVAKVVANGNPDLLAVGVLVGDGSLNVDEEEADFPVDADTSDEASLDNVPNNDVAIDACVPIVSSSAFDLTALAKSVFDEVNDPHLTEEENLLVMSSSVNTKKYEKSKRGVEQRFFDTIEKFGGEHLHKLTYYAEDGFTKERLFYIKLRGEKSQEKHFILNKCLVKIALKWRNKNQGSSNFGKHLQPSSWATLLKGLFAVFRKKNIQYNYATDFNGDGEFHAVLASMWEAERAIDPTFATGVQTSTCDMEADYKIRQQYKDGKFNPFNSSATEEAFRDRLKYCIWVLGRYLLCRGRNEIVYSTWKQVIFNSCKVGDVTEEYVEYRHHWDKSHKCKLKNTTPRDTVPARIYANPNDELCPHRFLVFLRSLCPPSQERVLCYTANSKLLNKYCSEGLPYVYNEKLPVGANTVGPMCKTLAEEMGFDDWEKCTNHGCRKMGISTAMSNRDKNIAPLVLGMSRHTNYQTSVRYQKTTDDMYYNYNRAVLGKHVASPPKRNNGKNK